MINSVIQLVIFILAALLSLPLAYFAWISTGFCGVKGICLLVDLPLLLPVAVLMCFASFLWGRTLGWIVAVLALIPLHSSGIGPFVALTPVLLQFGDYRPFFRRATT
jgi:hypothetical protein